MNLLFRAIAKLLSVKILISVLWRRLGSLKIYITFIGLFLKMGTFNFQLRMNSYSFSLRKDCCIWISYSEQLLKYVHQNIDICPVRLSRQPQIWRRAQKYGITWVAISSILHECKSCWVEWIEEKGATVNIRELLAFENCKNSQKWYFANFDP